MRQCARLGNCRVAPCQRLVGEAETKEDDRQSRLCCQLRVDSSLTHERVMTVRIVKRQHRFKVRSGRGKAADPHQVSTGRVVTHYEPGGIVPSTAQPQQILIQAQRYIQFAAMRVITGLPAGNLNEVHWGTELFPQFPRASVGLAGLRRARAFDDIQHRAQSAGKLELFLPAFGDVGQQRQLVQPLLKLRSRLRHR
jgi:hypothetical protein